MTTLQYVFLGVGVLAVLSGIATLVVRIRTFVSGCAVDGTVVDEKVSTQIDSKARSSRMSTPIFEFVHDGKTYRCQSTLGTTKVMPRGSKVRVRYLPSDPANTAEIDSVLAMWGFPVVALLFGGIMIAASQAK